MGKTIAEKILAKASGKGEVFPGDFIKVKHTSPHTVKDGDMGPTVVKNFKELGWNKIWDPNVVMIVMGHCGSASARNTAENTRITREWALKVGIPKSHIFELGRNGIGHTMAVENAWALPGTVYLNMTDGHGYTPGSLGCYALPLSYETSAFLITGKTWLLVPESIKINIKGKLKEGIMSRDVSEYLLGQMGPSGCLFRVAEYTGSTIDDMSIDERTVMTCLGIITGAMTSIINPDKKTIDYIKARTTTPFEPLVSDADAKYAKTFDFDVSNIEPQVVYPPERYTVVPVSKFEGTKIDVGYIGSCASGRIEDLRIAAKILKGKKIHQDVRLYIAPGTVNILKQALKEGLISIFAEAEVMIAEPVCGMCWGMASPLAGKEVCIASNTTNVPGRMGSRDAPVYLASPATVAASCIDGRIADPRNYLRRG